MSERSFWWRLAWWGYVVTLIVRLPSLVGDPSLRYDFVIMGFVIYLLQRVEALEESR